MSHFLRFVHAVRGGPAPSLAVSLEQATIGDESEVAFERLYDASFSKVYGFIRCQVSNIETAQELTGRVFLKAFKHRQKAPADNPAGMQWIFRIAHTTLIDYWRVDKRRESASLPLEEIAELPAESESPDVAFERKERAAHIVRVMNGLSHDDRTVLALKFSAQRTNREIAGILSLSEGAVSMRLLRALRRLRDELQDLGWR